ncbi:MAG: Gfo/Idh/MocA family oxidoreductase [Planctomycetales bacterium]|nr:Gfo/Idh/MocA family oxidoreductase [Planctomycetales bacterium]
MIRVGIAGLGFMGMVHYLSYEKLRGAKVVAICETNKKRLTGDWRDIKGNFGPAGKQMGLSGISTYTSLDDMLADPGIDMVDITLPPSLHADMACRAMRAGKHVFCEKPMALNASDCVRMVRTSQSTGKQLFIGHVLPFFPEYAWALKTVQSGKHGKLLGGSFKRVISDPAWLPHFWSAEHTGGPMLDLHVHDAHFIRLLFGMPSAVITHGRQRADLAEYWNTLFCYDKPNYTVTAASGTIAQQGRSFTHGFEIHLEKATLAFEFAVMGDEAKYLCPPTLFDDKGKAKPAKLGDGDPMNSFAAEIQEVVGCIRQQRESTILNSDLARDAILLCHKQSQSLGRGRIVKI